MTATPSKKQILMGMMKDWMTLVSIILPILIFYLIIGGMPRNYPGIASLYLYALILIVFTIYARYKLVSTIIRLNAKSKEVDKILLEINTLIKKTNPVVAKAAKRERDRGEFQ